ncbi:sulfite exporter TauE/SafE family protein [Mucilaginibacter rigui]|uniref:Sulfite exporter TauE/SafE family protein n=1 Tax=Mucilaginibacter rigui TaxID=534635 RepID=A0ABR7X187_9SPHI|nr:sulfite exporter TauE/SafE family protein [Mucilaginibacter rigui]MBD1384367.1 sulfite exporter TauE/SafE family protein [Mucilaginibacter rigui]
MSFNETAFLIGLFGSVHCIGMCGPLAFAIPVQPNRGWLIIMDKLIYNLGRTLSYALLGLLVGLLGKQLWLYGLQQSVSIISGVLIIMAATSKLMRKPLTRGRFTNRLLQPVNNLLAYALKQRSGHLIVGILNGFLPCGFVYVALIGAVNTPSVFGAVQYMFWFGLGTIPLMLAATAGSGFINIGVRRRLNRAVPYFMLCLGVWFVLRGLALNIPYLSPQIKAVPAVCK